MAKIRIITSKPGWGKLGDVLDVSPERAARWIKNLIAEDADPKAKKAAAEEPKAEEPKK